jgi:hypothetical protein
MKNAREKAWYPLQQLVGGHARSAMSGEVSSRAGYFSFCPGDTVLITTAADEQEWLHMVREGQRKGAHLLFSFRSDGRIQSLVQTIRRKNVTMLIVSARIWPGMYCLLSGYPRVLSQLRILVMNTPDAPGERYLLIPRTFPGNRQPDAGGFQSPRGIDGLCPDGSARTHVRVVIS